MNKTPTTLIIMDGFGMRDDTDGNAVVHAKTTDICCSPSASTPPCPLPDWM